MVEYDRLATFVEEKSGTNLDFSTGPWIHGACSIAKEDSARGTVAGQEELHWIPSLTR